MTAANNNGTTGPVSLDEWVQANLPSLHPTRRKVLKTVAALTPEGKWATSTTVRKSVGLSQQLLNRHLRALGSEGLLRLEKQGPGLPLLVQITPLGARAAMHLDNFLVSEEAPAASPAPPASPASPPTPPTPPPAQASQPEPPAPAQESAPPRQAATPPPAAAQPSQEPAMQQQLSVSDLAPTSDAVADALYQGLRDNLKEQDRQSFNQMINPVLSAITTAMARQAVNLATPQAPPRLSPAEEALERRLNEVVNPEYEGLPWHERTREFTNEYDQARKRSLGSLNTFFSNFEPRWRRRDWRDFNYARRQADAKGASYTEWIEAQFVRLAPGGLGDAPPKQLHGDEAVAAYTHQSTGHAKAKEELGPAPYKPGAFDINDPEHVAYAERLLDEMSTLGRSVYGDTADAESRLITQAVAAGNFPVAALDLRPELKVKILAGMRIRGRGRPARSKGGSSRPAVII